MILPLTGTGILLLATLLPCLLWALACWLRRRPMRVFLLRVFWLHVGLAAMHLLVTVPGFLGFVGSRWIDTRPDERAYQGPVLQDGVWRVQDRDSLRRGGPVVAALPPVVLTGPGARLGLYRVPAPSELPRARAFLVHGLFRNAMEVEPVGAMLRELGCEVWLAEMRNHGRSARSPATFGLGDADDLVAAIAELREQGRLDGAPLVLFGVSLGSVTVALAAPRIADLAGLVLDAPMEDLTAAGHRMLGRTRNEGRRVTELWQPWRSLTFVALEAWSGFAFAEVRPLTALAAVPSGAAALVIGAGDDDRSPPPVVEMVFDALPMPALKKELWIRPGSGHGRVWLDDPAGYRERLERLLQRTGR